MKALKKNSFCWTIFFLFLLIVLSTGNGECKLLNYYYFSEDSTTFKKSNADSPTRSLKNEDVQFTLFPEYFLYLSNAYNPIYSKNLLIDHGKNGFNMYNGYGSVSSQTPNHFLKPTTQILFNSGSKKNTSLEVIHQQRLGKIFSINIDYLTAKSTGFYKRSISNANNFGAEFKGTNHRKTYDFSLAFSTKKFTKEESGGLLSDSIYLNSNEINTQLYPSKLNYSDSKYLDRGLKLKQTFLLLNIPQKFSYSEPEDMLNVPIPSDTVQLALISEIKFNWNRYDFNSSQIESYYVNNYYTNLLTSDSRLFKSIDNLLGISLVNLKFTQKIKNSILLYSCFNNNNSSQNTFDNSNYFTKIGLRGLLSELRNKHSLSYTFSHEFSNSDVNYANQNYSVDFSNVITDVIVSTIRYSHKDIIPSMVDNFYHSNHFIWENKFNKTKVNEFAINLYVKKVQSFEFRLLSVRNLIYYNTLAIPEQSTKEVKQISISMNKNFSVGRFRNNNSFILNKTSDNKLLREPSFLLFSKLFLSTTLFKNHLLLEPGISCKYFTSYYGYSYEPATGQFYFADQSKIGNYPYFDFFVNFMFKRASLLFAVTHFNAGLNGKSYFMASHYPMPGRSFQIQLKWNLID
jgi:hypothetical protein